MIGVARTVNRKVARCFSFPGFFPAGVLIASAHLTLGAVAELARRNFDLPGVTAWLMASVANVPIWFVAILIAGAYGLVPSRRARWCVWALSFAVSLYLALEMPAARYFGLHLSWPMLSDGLSSLHVMDSVIAEIDRWTLMLVLASVVVHYYWAWLIFEPPAESRRGVATYLGVLALLAILWGGWAEKYPAHPLAVLFSSKAPAGSVRAGAVSLDKDLRALRFGEFAEPPEVRSSLEATRDYFAAKGVRPNVVFVVIESLAAQQLLVDGQVDDRVVPNLARLQRRGGVLFDQVIVNHPETLRANIALATGGRYPTWLDPASIVTRPWQGHFAVDDFRAAGYRTALFAAADLDFLGLGRFLTQGGYDRFVHFGALSEQERKSERLDSWGGRDDRMMARAAEWVEKSGAAPFFLQVLTNSPHHPYAVSPDFVPPPTLAAPGDRRTRYRRALAAADAAVGKLVDRLSVLGVLDHTLVVITGDHGEAFDEHGGGGHRGRGFDEAIRSFALFSLPDGRPLRSARVIANGDLLPTTAAIAGLPKRSAAAQGADPRQIQDATSSRWAPRLQFFHYDLNPGGWGLRDGNWKYISQASGAPMLFNLADDPDEKSNLIAKHSDRDKVYDQLAVAWYLERNTDFAADLIQPEFLPKLDSRALSSFGLKQLRTGYVEPVGEVGYRVVPAESFNPAEPIYVAALWAGFPVQTEVDYVWTSPDGTQRARRIPLNEGFRLHRIAMPAAVPGGDPALKAGKWRLVVRVGAETVTEQSFVIDPKTPRRFTGDLSRLDPVRAKLIRLEVGTISKEHNFEPVSRIRPSDAFAIKSTWRSGVYDEWLEYELQSPQGKTMPILSALKAGAVAQSEEITPPVDLWTGGWTVRLRKEGHLLAETTFEVSP